MKELQHLNKYFLKYKTQVVVGIIITITTNLFRVFVPNLIGKTIDLVSAQKKHPEQDLDIFKSELIEIIAIVIGAAVATGILTFFMRQTIINVSRYVEFDLKNEIYQQYQKLSLNFYKKNRTGDLMNRISEDVGKVRMYAGPAIMYSFNTITLFVVALIFMFKQAPMLTLYTFIPLPILSAIIYKISKETHKRTTAVQENLSLLSTYTQEAFSGVSLIKAYGIESKIKSGFESLADKNKNKHIHLEKIHAFFLPMMILLIGISNIIVIYFGGMQHIEGKISIGTIIEFIIYVNMLTWPVATVGWVTSIVQQAEASQKRINKFLKVEPEIKNTLNTPSIINGHISFKNVHFTYDDTNIHALKGINIDIKPGETLAIIGKTGSGKSTILDLISRLYDIDKGELLVDETAINKLNLNNLRNSIGYVPQDAFLFSDTINNNIKFGKENATNEEVITAAKNAQVHKNIDNFTNKYETILGERGITLSGGQKQRVSIARAIIKDPKILLFDDCLSAVDTETEEKILKSLSEISANKTTVIVSHRISSVKNADHIIVLNKGKIVEKGTHNSLINADGYYNKLYKKQLSENTSS